MLTFKMEIVKTVIVLFSSFQLVNSAQISLIADKNLLTSNDDKIVAKINFKADFPNEHVLCRITVEPPSAPVKLSMIMAMFTFDTAQDFEITAKKNVPFSAEVSFKIVLTCGNDVKEIPMILAGPDNSVDGDPHFTQLIVDAKSNKEESICYDVTGKSGEKIEIFSHQLSKTFVYGQLLDDYYMHIIEIFSLHANITVTTKDFLINNELLFTWEKRYGFAIYRGYGLLVKMDNDKIEISGFTNVGKNQLNFIVRRSHNSINDAYLDVQINGLVDYQNADGLLGRVGNNLFQFYDSIQNVEDINGNKRGTVSVNGRFALASKKTRYRTSCWLMNVKDVLHPYPISKYVLEN